MAPSQALSRRHRQRLVAVDRRSGLLADAMEHPAGEIPDRGVVHHHQIQIALTTGVNAFFA